MGCYALKNLTTASAGGGPDDREGGDSWGIYNDPFPTEEKTPPEWWFVLYGNGPPSVVA